MKEPIHFIENRILNANKLRSTRGVARKLFIEHFCDFKLDKRVFIANHLGINIFSSSFNKYITDEEIPFDSFFESILFSLRNLDLSGDTFRVKHFDDTYTNTKIKTINLVVNWVNIRERFCSKQFEIDSVFISLFEKVLNKTDKKCIYNCLKEYIRVSEYFEETECENKMDNIVLNFYLENDYYDIGLANKLTMSSDKFIKFTEANLNYIYDIRLTSLKDLKTKNELIDKVIIKIRSEKFLNDFEPFANLGFKYILFTSLMAKYEQIKDSKYNSYKSEKDNLDNLIGSLPVDTQIFLIDNFDFDNSSKDFLISLEDYMDKFGKMTEEQKNMFIIKYAI